MAKIKRGEKIEEINDGSPITVPCKKLGVEFECYKGECAKCMITVQRGMENLTPPTASENAMGIGSPMRLACQCKIKKGEIIIT